MSLPPGELLLVMAIALVGVPLAGILHELTHVLAIWPIAESVSYEWPQQYVEAAIREDGWREHWARAAGVAPLVVGVTVAVGLAAAGTPLQEPWRPWGLCQWGLWIAYSITGGVSDYLPELSRDRAVNHRRQQ